MGNRTEYVCTDFFFSLSASRILLYFILVVNPQVIKAISIMITADAIFSGMEKIKVKKWKCESKITIQER